MMGKRAPVVLALLAVTLLATGVEAWAFTSVPADTNLGGRIEMLPGVYARAQLESDALTNQPGKPDDAR